PAVGSPRAEPVPAASPALAPETAAQRVPSGPVDLVVMAASTGGPAPLTRLLQAIGRIPPPLVVAPHMPALFPPSLAQSLSQDTGLAVREGSNRAVLNPGEITILPGGRDALIAPRAGGFELRLTETDSVVHPSANALFESAAMAARRPVAVILTGMG